MSDARVQRLANLLTRGRQLHWQNAVQLGKTTLRQRLPNAPPPLATLVYQAVQLLLATNFIERRGYLSGESLDRFGAALFQRVAGAQLARVHGLVTNYAGSFDDEARFVAVVTADLSHAIAGEGAAAWEEALSGTPRAMMKTTHLYCAQVFDDKAVVRALS